MDDLLQIYERLQSRITLDEFKEKVQEKIDLMGGLCDEKTAAKLVAHDLGILETMKIGEISLDQKNVSFVGKVTQVDEPREFSRDDGSLGRVANLIVSDETGSIRVVLWDELADLVKVDELPMGQMLKISGYVKDGYAGIEVNVGRNGRLEFIADMDIKTKMYKISDIASGMSGINIIGKVLSTGETRTFSRKDGSEGYVCGLTIGDETDRIRVVLWNDHTKEKFAIGDVIEITNGYSRENYGRTEIHLDRHGKIEKSFKDVSYSEHITKIADIGINESYDIMGVVTEVGVKREFTRGDGSPGKVANIRISDDTGGIQVALWGEHADLVDQINIGTQIKITDGYAKAGWNDDIELNVDWRSTVNTKDLCDVDSNLRKRSNG
ncbi:MAG: OB-fold nucleic acid binding domain-containing protein [Methanocellales archaeon]|nr:OB-fold nucleic acid binding domain-containing protein [Methanocellales archaeon]